MLRKVIASDNSFKIAGWCLIILFLYGFWKILMYDKVWPLIKAWWL